MIIANPFSTAQQDNRLILPNVLRNSHGIFCFHGELVEKTRSLITNYKTSSYKRTVLNSINEDFSSLIYDIHVVANQKW